MQDFLFFKVDKLYVKLNFADILYIQAEKKYVTLVAIDNRYTTLCSIGNVEKILPSETFCKVHRSYIVSLKHTSGFDNEFVYIRNIKIPIAEQYRHVLKNSVITLNCEFNSIQSENNAASSQQDILFKIPFRKTDW
jgi:DNA-binding LytR/AlgR family response regulator